MKLAVLGGGNGSFAAAGDFALNGHEVRLWRRDASEVGAHRKAGGSIKVTDFQGTRDAKVAVISSDIREAIAGADLILCPLPAFAQPDIAQRLAPHLTTGQVVFLPPGTFGSVLLARAMREAGNRADVAFAETGTLPWLARKQGPYHVRISGRGKRLPTGVFPLRLAKEALAVVGAAFPGAIEPCGDALSAALMNAGPIIHPPLIMMNAGPIEHFDRWDIHKEGTQPAIRRVTNALDRERVMIREALGYGAPHFPLSDHYATSGDEWMYGRGSHDKVTDSGDWREHLVLTEHRYMVEDTRIGLSFFASVGDLAGVPAPLTRAFLAIGSAICGEDFAQTGRPLAKLGFGGLGRQKLQQILVDGL
jgi:opine dehydrogenase